MYKSNREKEEKQMKWKKSQKKPTTKKQTRIKHLNKTVQSDIVEPVDEVEDWEHGRENDPWPAINGIYIRQVGDFDF